MALPCCWAYVPHKVVVQLNLLLTVDSVNLVVIELVFEEGTLVKLYESMELLTRMPFVRVIIVTDLSCSVIPGATSKLKDL